MYYIVSEMSAWSGAAAGWVIAEITLGYGAADIVQRGALSPGHANILYDESINLVENSFLLLKTPLKTAST